MTPKNAGRVAYHSLSREMAWNSAAEVKDQSDLIVLLAHIAPAEFISEEVPEFSAHPGEAMNIAEQSRRPRTVVRVNRQGEELGRLDLQVDTEKKAAALWKWQALPIDSTKIQPAADVAALVKHWEGEVSARVDQPRLSRQSRLASRKSRN